MSLIRTMTARDKIFVFRESDLVGSIAVQDNKNNKRRSLASMNFSQEFQLIPSQRVEKFMNENDINISSQDLLEEVLSYCEGVR